MWTSRILEQSPRGVAGFAHIDGHRVRQARRPRVDVPAHGRHGGVHPELLQDAQVSDVARVEDVIGGGLDDACVERRVRMAVGIRDGHEPEAARRERERLAGMEQRGGTGRLPCAWEAGRHGGMVYHSPRAPAPSGAPSDSSRARGRGTLAPRQEERYAVGRRVPMSTVKAIPAGLGTITAQLTVDGAGDAIAFYKKALGAEEVMRAPDPSGKKIWHAELRIGSSVVFINDAFPDMGGGANVTRLWLYAENVDAIYKRATDAGMKVKMPLSDMFWGDRMGTLVDSWGNEWTVAQRTKEMTQAEMQKAQEGFVASMKK